MYRSLLVPLDGSAFGEQALPLACSLARRLGAALQVVHVQVSPAWGYGEYGVPFDATLDRELRARDRAYLDAVVERLAASADIRLNRGLLEGPVADAIAGHAAATGADLIIMTTHGRGALARFWLGSVADTLIRLTPTPVLLVPPQDKPPELAQDVAPRHVLVPLDGSELAEQALGPALSLGAAVQAEYTLLRVIRPMIPDNDIPARAAVSGLREPLLEQLRTLHRREWAEAERYLEGLAERVRVRSLTVRTRVVSRERLATAILEQASAHGAGLIALATHGRGGLKRLLLGSVADKVLRGASTPVLVCRPAGSPALAQQ